MARHNRKDKVFRVLAMLARRVMAHHHWVHSCMILVARFIRKLSVRIDHVVMSPFLEVRSSGENKCKQSKLPQWVRDEMLELMEIEPELGMTEDGRKRIFDCGLTPARAEPGMVYAAAWRKIAGRRFTHVVIAPWLVRGGADIGVIHHLEQLLTLPDANVLFVTTENVNSPWIERVDSRVSKLELGLICCNLCFDDAVVVLTRLVLQLQPNVVHIINSRAAWEMVVRHGLAVRQFSRIYASLYCVDYNSDGVAIDYATRYLRKCIAHLDRVFSDNSVMPTKWCRNFGISQEKFTVIYFPTKFPDTPAFSPKTAANRVLWAGRFVKQKNPALLARIAEHTKSIQYDIYGTVAARGIKFPNNVTVKGLFDGFETLPHSEYGCFLNTSLWDGLPNVLLEATAFGLPIVSTNVGGISDFLNKENSFLIEDVADIDAICEQINLAISVRELAQQRWRNAFEILSVRHTFESMRMTLSKIDGYFDCTPRVPAWTAGFAKGA